MLRHDAARLSTLECLTIVMHKISGLMGKKWGRMKYFDDAKWNERSYFNWYTTCPTNSTTIERPRLHNTFGIAQTLPINR